jgi:hypothetical protein
MSDTMNAVADAIRTEMQQPGISQTRFAELQQRLEWVMDSEDT